MMTPELPFRVEDAPERERRFEEICEASFQDPRISWSRIRAVCVVAE